MFKPAPPPRGKAISIYLAADALKLVQPWITGRACSARIGAILGRYADAAVRRPQFSLQEAAVLVRLLPPLPGMRDISALWAELLDCAREGERLPDGVNAEALANKMRRLTLGEQLGLLELADQVAVGAGSLRERLVSAGMKG